MKQEKKKRLSVFLVLIMLLQMIQMPVQAQTTPNYGAQNSMSKFENAVPVSVAHRAAWRVAPENSLLAIAASIEMGIDVVEIDVKLTSDNVVVLSHDASIDRCVSVSSGNVSGYSWEQLKETSLEPGKGGTDAVYIISEEQAALLNSLPNYIAHCGMAAAGDTLPLSRFDDAIDLIKQYGPNTMINLDHCVSQELFVSCYIMLRENGMLGNTFIKNSNSAETMNSWYDAAAEAWNAAHAEDMITAEDVKNSILYVYIISSEDNTPLQEHLDNDDNLVMAEICISDEAKDARIQEQLEPWCKENGVAMFVNTMWHGLCSTKDDCETTWAEMLDRGYIAIQTDCASELASYMYDYNRQRNSTETIQAEHFHRYDYDNYSFSILIASDENLNKCVEDMCNGDWLSYENILFDGNENLLNVNFNGLEDDAVLDFYLDEISENSRIATVNLYSTANYEDIHTLITGNIEAGVHTLYVQVTGADGINLVSIDDFSFVRSANLEGEVEFSQTNVETETGVAPVLPGTVKATIGGNSYNLKVIWEQFSAANYEQEGEFAIQGYVPSLKCYTQAFVTVRTLEPKIVQDEHLALWLDASYGVTAEGDAVTKWASRVGDIVAEVKSGSPTVVENAIGNQPGIQFDGEDDIMKLTMPDDFWNNKSEFTVLLFNSPEFKTNGSSKDSSSGTTYSQNYSILYFGETGSWGSALFTSSQNEVLFRFGSGVSSDYGSAYVRETDIGNIYTGTAIRKDGIDNSVFVDGKLAFTCKGQSYTTSLIKSEGEIGYGKKGNPYEGTICQILVYDRALTNDEIVAAQKWMSEKYYDEIITVEQVSPVCEVGNAPALPETVQVTYASGVTANMGVDWESVSPNNYLKAGVYTISGVLINGNTISATVTVTEKEESEAGKGNVVTDDLMLWLDAGYGVTTDENGAVTKWESKVGELYAESKNGSVTLEDKAANGQPGLVFNGTDSLKMQLATDAFNGLTGCTVIAYAASDRDVDIASRPDKDISYFGQRGTLLYASETEGWSSFYVGVFKDAVSARFGTCSDKNTGFAAYRKDENTDFTITAVRWDASAKTDNYDVEIDGEEFGTATSVGSETKGNADLLWIGEGKDASQVAQYWDGTACEILVYDRALTDGELADIYDYLNNKYENLASNVVRGVWLKEEGQELSSYRGTTLTLNAEVVPFSAGNQNLIWESSNPEVATVDENGNVTAVGTGYTTITVTTEEGGFSASCTLTVTKPQTESVWQDIQNMKEWADNQDADSYRNWDEMEEALKDAESVSQESSLESLLNVYQVLRNAKLALEKKPAAVDYGFAEGSENQEIEEGTSLTVDVEPDSRYFVGVKVDGETLAAEKYVVADGSVITLNAEFISTLSSGEYKLSVVFENGVAETSFTILEKQIPTESEESSAPESKPEESDPQESSSEESNSEESKSNENDAEETESGDDGSEGVNSVSPETGDEAPIAEMVVMLCLAVVGLTGSLILRKRQNR